MFICSLGRIFEACSFKASSAGSPVLHYLGCKEEAGPGEQLLLQAARDTQAFLGALFMQDETSNSKFVKA